GRDIDLDRAAAWEPDLPCTLVGHAELEALRRARLAHAEDREARLDHRGLDAAARNRAAKPAAFFDGHPAADWAGPSGPAADHRRERDLFSGANPADGGLDDALSIHVHLELGRSR